MFISIVAVPLFFAACKEENYPPVAKLVVYPTNGEVPLEVRMNLTGDDPNGIDDIKTYRLNIDKEVIKSGTPIDITRTFQNSGIVNIYGEVIDSENQTDKTSFSSVEIYGKPFLEQSASLITDVNIKYTAILSRVNSAILKIKRGGELLLTENITDSNQSGIDYEKTFNYTSNGITKGDYEFILKSENLETKTLLTVPNYNPIISIGNINIVLNEEADSIITLPAPLDKNPEDNPVAIKNAASLDGKTQLTLNGYKLTIKALPNFSGTYQAEIEFGSPVGGLEKAVIQGNIIKDMRMRVNPFVQPNDTTKPFVWNNFTTMNERNAHLDDRLYNYDKTDTMTYIPDKFVCTGFASQWAINFNGYGELGFDPAKGLQNNGWHNIPAYTVTLMKPNNFHAINAVMINNDATNINDWRFIEPESDSTYNLNTFNLWGVYKIVINHGIVINDDVQEKYPFFQPFFEFIPNGNGGWKDSGYRNPEVNLITQRGK